MITFHPYHEEKIWGRVMHCFSNGNGAVSFLETKQGFRCSWHRHAERANLFAVVSGSLVIEEECTSGYNRLLRLYPGDTHTIASRVWHRFRTLTDGEIVEIYWPDRGNTVKLDDIEREDLGGPDDHELLRQELIRQGLL